MAVGEEAKALIWGFPAAGDLRASFPLPAKDRTGRRWHTIRLASGSATSEVETFSGNIRLVRPGELRSRGDTGIEGRQ